MTNEVPANYNVEIVEAVILEIAAELHPELLSTRELILEKIVSNPDDAREVQTAAQAIRNLRDAGLVRSRDDETVEPTQAALRAVTLLT